ncbi:MAG: hypothetical protein GXY17_05910 [Clostridiaceae bacterium]|jgi:Na+-transporting methylmalonyl-CoA/oxaloacetate decarboxylase beta subunit|nr:hypothetical protein [Clostridiaceae bacterium]
MNIGIIGGSDGPTSIYIASSHSWFETAIIAIVFLAVIGLIVWLIRRNRKKRNQNQH